MKTIINKIFLLLCMTAFVASCDKDGDTVYLEGLESSTLIATSNDITLSVENSKDIVLSLAWKNPTLLSSDSTAPAPNGLLTTKLQVSTSESFSNVSENTVTNLSKAYTGTELNTLAKNLGLSVDVSSPLYFRIYSTSGDNIDPVYSNVCKVNVTPFSVDMSYLSVLNVGQTETLNYLYSPEENGVYTGWMNATSWLNVYFKENDGTIWGNYPAEGHVFEITNESGMWNAWFPNATGHYYVTVDTKKSEWSCMYIKDLKVNGESMTWNNSTKSFTYNITTTQDGETFAFTADALTYTTASATDDDKAEVSSLNFALSDGKMTTASSATNAAIEKAGKYTITVSIDAESNYVYTVAEAADEPDEPETPYPTELKIYSSDGSSVLGTLAKTSETGVYSGTITATQWLNFYVVDTENDIWYGCGNGSQFTLSTADDKWVPWLNNDFTDGATVTITADLVYMTWSYTVN